MKRIRFFLLLGVVALGVLGLISCPTDNGAGGVGGPTSELIISIDSAAARTYTIGGAAYLPAGSDGSNSPGVAANTTRLMGLNGDMTDMLILDCIGTGAAAGISDAAASEIQLILNIDGGAAGAGKSFIITGAGNGTVTVTAYGAVGGQVVGSFNLTGIEVNASGAPIGPTPTLIGTFDLYRLADQAVDE